MKKGRFNRATRLLVGAKKQRREKFERLVQPHIRALNRTALRMVGNSHTAEDVVQETCLRAYRSFDSYKDGTNVKAWVFRIMTNICIDHNRRKIRNPLVEWDEDGVEVSGIGAGAEPSCNQPDILFLYNSFRNDAVRAIARLSPELRMTVSLALLDDFTYEEIAEVVDCPVGTVRSRLNRGRNELRIELREYMPSGGGSVGASRNTKNRRI